MGSACVQTVIHVQQIKKVQVFIKYCVFFQEISKVCHLSLAKKEQVLRKAKLDQRAYCYKKMDGRIK